MPKQSIDDRTGSLGFRCPDRMGLGVGHVHAGQLGCGLPEEREATTSTARATDGNVAKPRLRINQVLWAQ